LDTGLDIVQFISDCGIDIRPKGDLYVSCCPFHSEKAPSFTVYPNTQSFYCFSCNMGGDLISFCMAYYQEDYKSTLSRLNLKDNIFSSSKLKDKLEKKVTDSHDKYMSTLLYINKLIYNKGLSLDRISIDVDKTLELPENLRFEALKSILDSLHK
jgi:DNA primase